MRPELVDPITDSARLQTALELAKNVYRTLEAGKDYRSHLAQLSSLTGRTITPFEVVSAVGSVSPETFVRGFLLDSSPIPTDLSDDELLELIERVVAANGSEFQIGYWVNCLRINTGDLRISDLIYWPGQYFEDGDNSRKMSTHEILDIALSNGKNRLTSRE